MSDPAQTQVIAVGISSYEIGPTWDLRRAAEHALNFAEWCRGAGVPASNVHLFLDARQRAALRPRLANAGVVAEPATSGAIYPFFKDTLPRLDGDVLLLFWSGHGSIT